MSDILDRIDQRFARDQHMSVDTLTCLNDAASEIQQLREYKSRIEIIATKEPTISVGVAVGIVHESFNQEEEPPQEQGSE